MNWTERIELLKQYDKSEDHSIANDMAYSYKMGVVGEAITRVCPEFDAVEDVWDIMDRIQEHIEIKKFHNRFYRAMINLDFTTMEETIEAVNIQIHFYRNMINDVVNGTERNPRMD